MIYCGLTLVCALLSVCKLSGAAIPQYPILPSDEGISFDPAFDDFVEQLLKAAHVPGLSIAVVDNGRVISKGYGYAFLEPRRNATADTQYFTGSTTKAFTAAALASMIHSNSSKYSGLEWSTPINSLIRSDFVLEDDYSTSHITLEDALSHRTGLPRHDLIYGQPGDTPSAVVQRMRFLPKTAEPRTLWQYCNLMFVVATDVIETLTGRTLEEVLEEKFWGPLGMSSTTFTIPPHAADDSKLARGYYWDEEGCGDSELPCTGQYVPDPYIDIFPISGAGATISTVNDYAIWMKALLNAAHGRNDSSPISRTMLHDLWKPRSIVDFRGESKGPSDSTAFMVPATYALGWCNYQIFGNPLVTHGGGLKGFGTELYMLPDQNFGVVTMGNTGPTSNAVGGLICVALLLRKLSIPEVHMNSVSETLLRMPRPWVQASKDKRRREASSQRTPRDQRIPPPLPLAKFAGVYSHPAYGQLNFTLTSSTKTSSKDKTILEALFYPRTWPAKIQLSHLTDNFFTASLFSPHGLGDIVSGEGIVWERLGEADAVFELGLEAEAAQMLGLVLDFGMAEAVERKGEEKHWREAMVWFEKV